MPWIRATVVYLCCAASAFAADWPQWLGPRRDGSTTEKVAPWTRKQPPKVLWRVALPPAYSSPVVAGGKVYIHTGPKDAANSEEQVLAFDAVSGKPLWNDVYERPKYQSVLGTGPRATPTISGQRLYTLGINGVLSCYQLDKGKRLWQTDLYHQFQATLPSFAVCCSPLVVGNRVIVSVGGKDHCVVALHADSGEVQWQSLDDAASTSSPILFTGGERPAGTTPDVVFMTPLRVLGLDPLDGSIRWEHPMVYQPQGTSPTPLPVGDTLVTSTRAHGAVAVRVSRKSEDEGKGATAANADQPATAAAWKNKELKSYFSSGAVSGELLFLVTNTVEVLPSASLSCLDSKSGKLLWSKNGVGYFHAGVIRTGDGRLLVLNDSGKLTLLEVDAKGSKELATATVCGGTLVNPALADGRLYVRDDKELICLKLEP